jgi:hypothetical protein
MKVLFKDFQCESRGFLGLTSEPFAETVERMNDWIAESSVEVVNIETLLNVSGQFTSAPRKRACGAGTGSDKQALRPRSPL